METSKHSSAKRGGTINRIVTAGWLGFSFIGFLDATYLTIQHFRGAGLECAVLKDCDVVTTSQYAIIGGIPLALLGSVYYLSIFLLTFAYLDSKHNWLLPTIGKLTILGFLASLILVYLQIFVIHALCLYCLISACTSTCLFVLALIRLKV